MRRLGIHYDTGFWPGGHASRDAFEPARVRRELEIIARDLRCPAVRLAGGSPERLTLAGEAAVAAGLEVWFSPHPAELGPAELRPYLAECAARAEALRSASAREVVLVLGCELSAFASGFLPGGDVYARLASLLAPTPELFAGYQALLARFNALLADLAAEARRSFGGRITYASGPWEQVDWRPFDIVGVDAYRDAGNAATYEADLRAYLAHGKPLAVTEFGCCTYRGAADRGSLGWNIVDRTTSPPRLNGPYVRDEQEQVRYLHELRPIFERVGVDTAFWFTFASFNCPYSADPAHDLDFAAYGTVKLLPSGHGLAYPDLPLEPKAVFHALAEAVGT